MSNARPGRVLVVLVAAVALALASCGSDSDSAGGDRSSGSDTIEVHDASIVVPPNPAQAAVRFEIDNDTDVDDELVAVSSPVAERADVHESSVDADGRATMDAVPSLAVPAGSTVTFAAGGLHVMLTGLGEELEQGDTFPMTLTFEEAGDVTVTVDVVAPGQDTDTEEHDHG